MLCILGLRLGVLYFTRSFQKSYKVSKNFHFADGKSEILFAYDLVAGNL